MCRVYVKGAMCSFGDEIKTQNFNINNINEVIIQNIVYFHRWINKLFSASAKYEQS